MINRSFRWIMCGTLLAGSQVPCLSFAQAIPIGNPGGAAVNIQLPVVSVVSVQTTVSVPDGGAVSLGGLTNSAAFRNQAMGQFPFGGSYLAGNQVSTRATITDFQAIEEQLGLRLADRFVAEQNHAQAITQLTELLDSPSSAVANRAQQCLEQLRSIGRMEFDRHVSSPNLSFENYLRAHKVAESFGHLIDADRLSQLRSMEQSPEIAEQLHGAEAEELYFKAEQADNNGKASIAVIYYRMAARYRSTRHGGLAQHRLESLQGSIATRQEITARTDLRSGPPDFARLAALYKGLDKEKAAKYSQKAQNVTRVTGNENSRN